MKLKRPFLTAVLLIISTAGFTACPGPEPLPPPTPEPELTWQITDPASLKPLVGDWQVIECPSNGLERSGDGKSVTMGLGGYASRCAVGSPSTIDLSSIPDGTEMRVTLKQRSGPFKQTTIPFWTHLWLCFNAAAPVQASSLMDTQNMRAMVLSDGDVSVANARFTKTAGMKTLDLAVGFDPAQVVLTKPEDQPVVEFQEVHLESLLPPPGT